MKIVITFLLFIIAFATSATKQVNKECNYFQKMNGVQISFVSKIHSTFSTLDSSKHEFFADIEKDEKDEEELELLFAVLFSFYTHSLDLKTNSNSFYSSKNIVPTLPRFILHEVFRI